MAERETVKLEFEHWVIDSWTYEVGGTEYTVEKGGTDVPKGKADEIIAASRKTGAPLRKA